MNASLKRPSLKSRSYGILKCHNIVLESTATGLNVQFSEAFSSQFPISSSSSGMGPEELISYFNSTCVNILDYIAPFKLKCHKTRNQPWLNSESRVLRQKCRQAERKWKQDKFQVSYEILRDMRTYQTFVKTVRSTYFSNLINSNAGRPKVLFSTINKVLNPIATLFPDVSPAVCNDFL